MDSSQLQRLIQQSEGLKLDFKQEFYHVDHDNPQARERQWGELIKDLLALANGNVNIAGETAYLIIGVGDDVKADGSRELFDVGLIATNRQQILAKVNAACSPPLPDIHCDLLLLEGRRIFVITIPPSPHLHQTTKQLETSSGRRYPENTLFIRRGEGTHTASIMEAQAILSEKQRVLQKVQSNQEVKVVTISSRDRWNPLADRTFIAVIIAWILVTTTYSLFEAPSSKGFAADIFVGGMMGLILGLLFALWVKVIHSLANRSTTIRSMLMVVFWIMITLGIVLGILTGGDTFDLSGRIMAGSILGLFLGSILILILYSIDSVVSRVQKSRSTRD